MLHGWGCRRQELSYECKATLFDQEVHMAENIDFQFPMKKACAADMQRFCKARAPCASPHFLLLSLCQNF